MTQAPRASPGRLQLGKYITTRAIYSGLLALLERLHRLHAGVGGQHLLDLDDLRDAVNHLLAELHLGEACALSTFSRKLQLASISVKKKKIHPCQLSVVYEFLK